MKKTIQLLAAFFIFASFNASGQFAQLKKFDYSLLKSKTLYIEKLSETSESAKKYLKKFGKNKQAAIEGYNKLWTDALAKSSYDATPYEIKDIDIQKLFKEKNPDAIVIMYREDKYGNVTAEMWITGPKHVIIATTVINGLNLWDVDDVSLMINMLNYSLNEYAEIDATSKDKSNSALRNKYKENMVVFFDKLPQQVFYVSKEDGLEATDKEVEKLEKDPASKKDPENQKYIKKYKKTPAELKKEKEKATAKNKEIEDALKENWNLCKYEMITDEDLQKKKEEGVNNGFYWKSFKYYTNSPFMTYKIKYLLTIDRDEVVFFYTGLGSAAFKASTVKDLQEKIVSQAKKYKKQLAKSK